MLPKETNYLFQHTNYPLENCIKTLWRKINNQILCMRKGWLYGIALSLFFSSISPLLSVAQEPDLSKIPDPNQKIGALLGYCEALRLNTERKANNYPMLQKTALE